MRTIFTVLMLWITILAVTANGVQNQWHSIVLENEGVVAFDNTEKIAGIGATTWDVHYANGKLYFSKPVKGIFVYTTTGTLVKRFAGSFSEVSVHLVSGIYIVQADSESAKLLVRNEYGGTVAQPEVVTQDTVSTSVPLRSSNASKPRITSPSDRSSSVLGNDVNVYVSGNNIEVIYAGLTGNPNPSNSNESNFYKGTMYQSGNRFYFTPNTSTWENKWVKIIAHDKVSDGWSDPVYVKINPKPFLSKPQWVQELPTNVVANQYYTISWKQVANAQKYRVYFTQGGSQKGYDYTPSGTSQSVIIPNISGTAYIGIIAIPDYSKYNQSDELTKAIYIWRLETINKDRWTTQATTVYNDWNPSNRKSVGVTIPKDTRVNVRDKFILGNDEFVEIWTYNREQGNYSGKMFINAKHLTDVTYLEKPKIYGAAPTITNNGSATITWVKVPNAQFYIINWSLGSKKGSFSTKSTSITIKFPSETGVAYVDVFACGSYNGKWVQSENLQLPIKVSPSSGSSNNSVSKSDLTTLADYLFKNQCDLYCKISGSKIIKIIGSYSAAGKLYIVGESNVMKSILKLDNGSGYYNIDELLKNQNFITAIGIKAIGNLIDIVVSGSTIYNVWDNYKYDGDLSLAIMGTSWELVLFAAYKTWTPLGVFLEEISKLKSAGGDLYTTFNVSDFVKFGGATQGNYSGYNYIGNINSTNGFRFSVNSGSTKTVKLSILYRSDNRGGKLIVNGTVQNIIFSSSNWNWGTKEVQVQLKQGTNNFEFKGGYQTEWAPDIAQIIVTW